MIAVELFENPLFDELVSFVENNKSVGARWAALHKTLTERVIPARAAYRFALDAAAKERAAMQGRHADSLKAREDFAAKVRELDRYVAEQIPAEIKASEEAPARIAVEANRSLTESEVSLVSFAIDNYAAFRA
jgi:hypothetical protein